MHEARAAALQLEVNRLEGILAERDDLIVQLRADVANLGAQVKNVEVNAGGNTTTNRIFSPGGGAGTDAQFAAPGDDSPTVSSVPTGAKVLLLLAAGLALYKLKR